jgi:mono/diheme cytochrome c family protein
MTDLKYALSAAVLLFGAGSAANAQSIEFGKTLFEQNCASCHGIEGAGDGPVAAHLQTKPANLKQLASANNGTFPFGGVWDSISKGSMSAHGTSAMPVWGQIFMEDALPKEVHPGISAKNLVEARMIALTYYIQTLQE